MTTHDVPLTVISGHRIGFLADTHCHKPDQSDLPAVVLKALRGADLIVHLGDMGERWVLDRLQNVAPVLATRGADDPAEDPRIASPARVIEVGGLLIGALFDLAAAGIGEPTDGRLTFSASPPSDALRATFGRAVDVVAFASTHRQMVGHYAGVLFVNPGSATLPAPPDTSGTVAILDVTSRVAMVNIVHLPRGS